MNIIVNGGTRGIGKEVVIFLSRDNNNSILVTGRNEKELSFLDKLSGNIHVHRFDLSDFEAHADPLKGRFYGHCL